MTTASTLLRGVVTLPEDRCSTIVDAVVTEFGVAWLRGQTLAERARRMAAIAAPEHREALERTATALAS